MHDDEFGPLPPEETEPQLAEPIVEQAKPAPAKRIASSTEPVQQAAPANAGPAIESESAKEQEEKKRWPFLTIFTFIACCFGVLQFFRELVEHFDKAIEAVAEALQHVDIFGLAGGYVDGLRLHGPSMNAGWAYPWEALLAGIQGMWSAMTSGGWLAIVAGIFVIAIGLGATIWALAKTDDSKQNPFSIAILCVLGMIVSVAVGFVVNVVIAQFFASSGFAQWVAANTHDLGVGLGYERAQTGLFYNSSPALGGLLERLTTPPGQPSTGDYHDAGAFVLGFIWSHGLFAFETLVLGIIALAIVSRIGGIATTILVPFAALAVLVIGATAAYAIDHLILLPAVNFLLIVAGISAAPVGLGAVAFVLEKGHLAMSFFESGKKLITKE